MPDLAGQVAVVTGAGQGIGRSIALALASSGARIALMARTASALASVRDEIAALQGAVAEPAAVPIVCDVTDAGSVRHGVAAAARALGPAAILVNGAGDAVSAPFVRTDNALWERMLAVNLTGSFLMMREIVPAMIERGRGRIVNVCSVAGLSGAPYVSAYSAAKHGVIGLTRCLAQELAKNGITVNAVCPGYVETPLTERSIANIEQKTQLTRERAREALEARSPQRRLIAPEEVAALVLHLVSDDARGINGQALVIDGGGLVS